MNDRDTNDRDTNDRIDELIALAAFGELDSAEQRELDAAAAADPAVAVELAAELETAAALLAASPMAAPSHLRGEVLAAIASTPQDGKDQTGKDQDGNNQAGAVQAGAGQAGAGQEGAARQGGLRPAPPSSDEQAPVVSLDAARQRRRRLSSVLAAAAAVVLVVGASVIVLNNGDDAGTIEAVAGASDAVERVFDGELEGSLVLFYSASEDAVAIEGERIPSLAPDKAYVLWTITDDAATPVGQFRPDDDGSVTVRLDGVDPSGAQLGITEEPITGSDVPTLPIKATA